ncbi:MAG: AAA family ATPase, partial [Bdellovibrionales bacterium]|nr:AAA family ATPase [Oligoflexia bacterium]
KSDKDSSPAYEVTAIDIEEMIAQMARIPAKTVTLNQKDRLQGLDRNLKLTIFGQDNAVDKIVASIRLSRSGLRSGDKPIGSFLFCGPTGVGKTELSKQLASHMGVSFIRFDMSEYMEQHTVSRLIGAPPGYVGFEQAGLMTDAVTKNPHAVVLLDEIEKAHPSVWNILLQVMDHGFLTDNNGKKADFRNVVLIMTSNVGSRDAERRSVGFAGDVGGSDASSKELERTFSPEFRNRLDSIVFFNSLDLRMMDQVVNKQLVELEHLLLAKNIEIEFDQSVRDWLGKKGYDRKMGPRPLGRAIQDEIKRPLSEEILFGKLEKGGSVQVIIKDDKPFFLIEKKAPAEKLAEESVEH